MAEQTPLKRMVAGSSPAGSTLGNNAEEKKRKYNDLGTDSTRNSR